MSLISIPSSAPSLDLHTHNQFLEAGLYLQEGELITAIEYLDCAEGLRRLGHRAVIFDLLVTDQGGVPSAAAAPPHQRASSVSQQLGSES